MKMVICVIRPHKLNDVKEALVEIGIVGMTAIEVKGFGRQKGHTELYRGSEYSVDFQPKIRLEIAIREDQLEETVQAIRSAAETGRIGDGKIFVLALEDVMRIRTGETGQDAI